MDSTVAIRSFMMPMEGELARARLAQAGIPSCLEGADLETWFWHYIYAMHGVTLRIRASDEQRAEELLATPNNATAETAPPRPCEQCGETLPGEWDVCWRCGTDRDGTRDEKFFVDSCSHSLLVSHLERYEYLSFLLFLLAALWVIIPNLAFLWLVLLPVYALRGLIESGDMISEPEEDATLPAAPLETEVGDEWHRRAMASAMFGFGWFPPLTLFSIWLLYHGWEMTLGPKGELWRRVAWVMNTVCVTTIILSLALLTEFLATQYYRMPISYLIQGVLEYALGLPPFPG